MKRLPALFALLAVFSLFTATAAQAAPKPQAKGSIVMSGPAQAAQFNVRDRDPKADKGWMTYTNFEEEGPGSGVWVPDGTFDVSFETVTPVPDLCMGNCVHTLTITGFDPLSPNSVSFEGTGFFVQDPSFTETFTGTVVGDQIELTLVPDDGGAQFGWTFTTLVGTIAADGSVTGTWTDNLPAPDGPRSGTFEIADIGYEALSFTAKIACAEKVSDGVFVFGLMIPDVESSGVAAGFEFLVRVTDDGTNDTYEHQGGLPADVSIDLDTCTSSDPFTPFPIVDGNIVVKH
jgi:hypothetical protein